MTDAGASETTRALAIRGSRELSHSGPKRRFVRSAPSKQWQPPEGLAPEDVLAVIDAAPSERDRLLLRVLWATGARISEALALRAMDVRRDSLVLPNLKNPSRPTKRVFLPVGQADLPGALLLWAKEHHLADDQPLFFSRKHTRDGRPRAISRQQAWEIVRAASEQANVRVLALRHSTHGRAGEPAPVHPHLFRHARVRQIVRTTKSLPIAQKQAGWSRLQMAYLSVSDAEVRDAMRTVDE
jgi:integrase/recombinase XerD